MPKLIRPAALKEGDAVALVTLAWGGAAACPERYAQGKRQIEESFRLHVIDAPNATKPADWIYAHPEARLQDLLWAFSNPTVKGIITIIGGSDSIRMLDHLKPQHLEIIRKNPKIFIGFSDTTVVNFICLKAGLAPFYGPTVLFGLAENCGIHEYTKEHFRKALFSTQPIGEIVPAKGWVLDQVPWTAEGNKLRRKMQKPYPLMFVQGRGVAQGHLVGGCMDTLEILKGTTLWPEKAFWKGAVLFIETSEDKPTPDTIAYWLRNYGAQGILQQLSGILFAIPGGDVAYDDPQYEEKVRQQLATFDEYDEMLAKVAKEYGRDDLIIVSRLNFGHNCPMLTIPYGATVRLDAGKKRITIVDSGVK